MQIGEVKEAGVSGGSLAFSVEAFSSETGGTQKGLKLSSEALSGTQKSQKKDSEDSGKTGDSAKEFALEKPKNADNNNSDATVKVVDQTLRFEIKSELNPNTGAVEKKLVVSVLDGKTGDVIRTVPPDELKTQLSKASSLIGVMLDKAM